ncbi:MAG TPA: hypothetical protein VGL71_10835, partial [Urbifossiella sp.]
MPDKTIEILHHGTTRKRAESLIISIPDANYIDPGGDHYSRANGISFVVAGAADFGLGTVE